MSLSCDALLGHELMVSHATCRGCDQGTGVGVLPQSDMWPFLLGGGFWWQRQLERPREIDSFVNVVYSWRSLLFAYEGAEKRPESDM